MITKEFLEKHFKMHNKLTVYQGELPLTVSKAWHLRFNGGHHEFDISDCTDLAELCEKRGLTLQPCSVQEE